MPAFGSRSKASLEGIDPRLQALAHRVIEVIDFTVLEGLRSMARQRDLFDKGKSKTLTSRHLVGMAFDFAPWPIPKNWEPKRFIMLGGFFMATAREMAATSHPDLVIRWGGDWRGDFSMTTWPDYGHIEIPRGKE